MDRDVDKAKKSMPAKKLPTDKSVEKRQPSSDDGKHKRGWSDVFDDSTYSNGPGDNIYVFG
ncbi:MAG: hypothetical protein NTZ17_19000 [Phycisphaerae bacterium]|nr:hypothetical protein [Phycisphaerae bacterium]